MESNAPVPPPGTSLFEMEIDALGQNQLNNISKWGKFIAITALVIVGLCVLGLATQYDKIASGVARLFAFDSNMAGIVIVILAVVGGAAILMLVFLLRACIFIKRGLVSQNSDLIADGFRNMKSVFTISIIFSSLSILGIIFSLFN